MKKRVLFIDRDGTIIVEPPITEQVNNLQEMTFLPGVIRNLYFIAKNLDFELVMVTNQDGLGTDKYPQENFDEVQFKMLEILRTEGVQRYIYRQIVCLGKQADPQARNRHADQVFL